MAVPIEVSDLRNQRFAPAFDVTWAYDPSGTWTSSHQMSVNGKQDGFTREDLLAPARVFGIKDAAEILARVGDAAARWPSFAREAGVPPALRDRIRGTLRLDLARKKRSPRKKPV